MHNSQATICKFFALIQEATFDMVPTQDTDFCEKRLNPLEDLGYRLQSADVLPITDQYRGARAMLGKTIADVAYEAGVAARTVFRSETGSGMPGLQMRTLQKLIRYYERMGIEFTFSSADHGPGIRYRDPRRDT